MGKTLLPWANSLGGTGAGVRAFSPRLTPHAQPATCSVMMVRAAWAANLDGHSADPDVNGPTSEQVGTE